MELKTLQATQDIKDKIMADLPREVIFKKPGKGDLDYISITFVTDLLNATFGHFGWDIEIVDKWIQNSVPFFQKNDRYNTAPKENETINEKGEPGQWLDQNPIAWVTVRLTVRVYNAETNEYVKVVKEASGSKIINGKAGEQEHIFKSAQSDAIKKAASMLGIGLELARKAPEKEYFEELNSEPILPIWDEDMQAKHADEWNIIVDLCEAQGWSTDDLAYYVELATDATISDIFYLPENKMPELIKVLVKDGLIENPNPEEGEE